MKRTLLVGIATASIWVGIAAQASAAGRLSFLQEGVAAPPGAVAMPAILVRDQAEPALGACETVSIGTLENNDAAEITGSASNFFIQVLCEHISVTGFITRMKFSSGGTATAVATPSLVITEPGPCSYTLRRVSGAFNQFGGTALFEFHALAKVTRDSSIACTVGREISGVAKLDSEEHMGVAPPFATQILR
jgi:hypothetical protein